MSHSEAFKKYPALAEFARRFPSKYGFKGESGYSEEYRDEVIPKEDVLAFFSSPRELKTKQFKVRLLPYDKKESGYGFSLPLKDFRDVLSQYPSDSFKGEELVYALEIALLHLLEREYGNVLMFYDQFKVVSTRVVERKKPEKTREEKKKNIIDQLLETVKEVIDETDSPEP